MCVFCEHLIDVLMPSCYKPLVVVRENICYPITNIVKTILGGSKESHSFSPIFEGVFHAKTLLLACFVVLHLILTIKNGFEVFCRIAQAGNQNTHAYEPI